MSSRYRKSTASRRSAQPTARKTSNVFAMFSESQVREFKEAFNMIDQNKDGFIDKEDLKQMFASLGQDKDEAFLDDMIGEAVGAPINFTMFLTLFGDKMSRTDPESVIHDAFEVVRDDASASRRSDQGANHVIHKDVLRELLTTLGDRYTNEQVDELYIDAPIKDDMFDFVEFTRMLKHGTKDDKKN